MLGVISYEALVVGHGCIVWSRLCVWFGGVNWVKALGGGILLCFVTEYLLTPGKCYWTRSSSM